MAASEGNELENIGPAQKIREAAAHPDLQIVQSINSVDELDKISNLMAMRVREWYGLHFPELDALAPDPMA